MRIKRLLIVLIVTAVVLLIPLIVMQFNDAVNWEPFDFMIAAIVLLAGSILIERVLTNIKQRSHRIFLLLVVLLVLLLTWAELSVGIFGSPISGN